MFAIAYQRGDYNYVNEEAFSKYFLPKIAIEKYKVEIDERKFMIKQLSIQLNKMRKWEKYQQENVMIIRLLLILKEITN